jgi:hypothetical protein
MTIIEQKIRSHLLPKMANYAISGNRLPHLWCLAYSDSTSDRIYHFHLLVCDKYCCGKLPEYTISALEMEAVGFFRTVGGYKTKRRHTQKAVLIVSAVRTSQVYQD